MATTTCNVPRDSSLSTRKKSGLSPHVHVPSGTLCGFNLKSFVPHCRNKIFSVMCTLLLILLLFVLLAASLNWIDATKAREVAMVTLDWLKKNFLDVYIATLSLIFLPLQWRVVVHKKSGKEAVFVIMILYYLLFKVSYAIGCGLLSYTKNQEHAWKVFYYFLLFVLIVCGVCSDFAMLPKHAIVGLVLCFPFFPFLVAMCAILEDVEQSAVMDCVRYLILLLCVDFCLTYCGIRLALFIKNDRQLAATVEQLDWSK